MNVTKSLEQTNASIGQLESNQMKIPIAQEALQQVSVVSELRYVNIEVLPVSNSSLSPNR